MSNSRPENSVIDIDFVAGIERDARFPKYLAAAGLTQRFAVVQHTGVEGADDMIIDEALWRALVSFAAACEPAAAILVAPRERTSDARKSRWPTIWSNGRASFRMIVIRRTSSCCGMGKRFVSA